MTNPVRQISDLLTALPLGQQLGILDKFTRRARQRVHDEADHVSLRHTWPPSQVVPPETLPRVASPELVAQWERELERDCLCRRYKVGDYKS